LAALLTLRPYGNAASLQTPTLTWSDEFDGPAGSEPNPTNWGYDIGGGGWGNNELQSYTNRRQNSFLDGEGNLVIKALRETFTGSDGITRDYTSARLLTKGKFNQAYGRFEARLKLPIGQGLWPAFWMLGNDIDQVGWPRCGEIDIMEYRGREPSISHGSLHGQGYSGANALTGHFTLSGDRRFSDDFHVFAVDWSPESIRFYVDGILYQTKGPANLPAGARWAFDHPFFIILNVAVGGNFGGNPDSTTSFPQTMTVDYVRVYRDPSATSKPVIVAAAVAKKNLIVSGEEFDESASILVDGRSVKTKQDGENPGTLIGKKAGKKIDRGQTVILQVRNSDGGLSPDFAFTRP
jgi:beta-glucanase (GH16 family)